MKNKNNPTLPVANPRPARARVRYRRATSPFCVECGQPLEGSRFAFAGAFACEQCVRKHYASAATEVVETELRERAKLASYATYSSGVPSRPSAAGAILCNSCRSPINGTPFAFAGGLACEQCVRVHCAAYPKEEVEMELRERAERASAMLR